MTGRERLGLGGLPQGFGSAEPFGGAGRCPAGIAAIDDDLSAFVAIDADGARRAAAAADAELKCSSAGSPATAAPLAPDPGPQHP
jgi:hypothetical protein